jgi:hypothetical protein
MSDERGRGGKALAVRVPAGVEKMRVLVGCTTRKEARGGNDSLAGLFGLLRAQKNTPHGDTACFFRSAQAGRHFCAGLLSNFFVIAPARTFVPIAKNRDSNTSDSWQGCFRSEALNDD